MVKLLPALAVLVLDELLQHLSLLEQKLPLVADAKQRVDGKAVEVFPYEL